MYTPDERKKRKLDYEKQIAVAVVHSSAVGIGAILSDYQSEADRLKVIRTYTSPIRFYMDESGYFFVFTLAGLNIVHGGFKELEGKNMFDVQDSKGNYLVRKMCAVARRGGGFVEYYWGKPGSESGESKRKIGYIEPIPATDYFIGAGVYMEE